MSTLPELPRGLRRQSSTSQSCRSGRAVFGYLAISLGLSWTVYMIFNRSLEPPIISYAGSAMQNSGSEAEMEAGYKYGENARPSFTDMVQLLDLPSNFIPETGKHRHPGRLVIVGDVHGQLDALKDLLEKVEFHEKHDHLILAGDMISKGPDSPGVVDLAMKLSATGVRGNHEDRIILAYTDMEAKNISVDPPGSSEERQKPQDALEEESFSHGDYKDRVLVKLLGKKRIKWLKQCPVILRIGRLGGMGEVVVVHAGLAPGVRLQKQDPTMVMNMRTIKDGVPSEEREGVGWMEVWNKHQNGLPKKDRSTVIYGHDSKRGLQIGDYSMGIDTGCLRGGRLTAVVIEGGPSKHKHNIMHVDCKDGRVR